MDGPSSLDDALTEDHVQLDAFLRTLLQSTMQRDPDCLAALDLFERRLLRHMTWEEGALFPALREGGNRSLLRNLESLVIDHDRLRESLAALRSQIQEGQWPKADRSIETLGVFLEGHNRDEEKGAYTAADQRISDLYRRRLLAEWRALS
jgi:hypothetical protein